MSLALCLWWWVSGGGSPGSGGSASMCPNPSECKMESLGIAIPPPPSTQGPWLSLSLFILVQCL